MKHLSYLMLFAVCLCVAGCKKSKPETDSVEPTASSSAVASLDSAEGAVVSPRIASRLNPEVREKYRPGSNNLNMPAGQTDAPQQCEKMCMITGRCVADGEKCIATKPEHCRKSFGCRVMGQCSLNEKRGCSALTEADCAGSEMCQFKGACIPINGKCSNGMDKNAVSMPPSESK